MQKNLIRRIAIAVAVPAALVGTLGAPAHAAKAPATPSLAKVAAIYPHLSGGTANVTRSKVQLLKADCTPGKAIKGASESIAVYSPAGATAMPSSAAPNPVMVVAARFASAASAKSLMKASSVASRCSAKALGDIDVKVKPVRIKIKGVDQAAGATATFTASGTTFVSQSLFVRDGNKVVSVAASSADGVAPAKSKLLKTLKLALKTAR